MHFKRSIFILIEALMFLTCLLPHVVQAGPPDQLAQPAGGWAYKSSQLTWTGPVVPGKPNVTLKGNIVEIRNQTLALNPNYETDFPTINATSDIEALEKRVLSNLLCNVPGGSADLTLVNDILAVVNKQKGLTTVPAGPRVCAWLLCGRNFNVAVCNDNNHQYSVSTVYMGYYMTQIISRCSSGNTVNGQLFDTDNYNLLIKGSC